MTNPELQAQLRYLVPTKDKPIYYASLPGADAQLRVGAEFEDRVVPVHDARKLATPARLDDYGFELHNQSSAISDFYQLQDHQVQYEAELKTLVLQATGGTDLLVFDHTLRSDSDSIRGLRNTREAAAIIHNDYTDASAEIRLRDLLEEDEASRRLQSRYAIVNTWRSINQPVETSPLAVCDARSLATEDLIASERRAEERIGELELATFNAAHRWYYYPRMNKNEVLLLKTFDSSQDGRARRAIHTAFDNPAARPDAPSRESIESRMLVFF